MNYGAINDLMRALKAWKSEIPADAYETLNWHVENLQKAPEVKHEPTCMLYFTCLQTSAVNFSMLITQKDAELIRTMTEEDAADWIVSRQPDWSTGLYDWNAGKEHVESTDSPFDIILGDE